MKCRPRAGLRVCRPALARAHRRSLRRRRQRELRDDGNRERAYLVSAATGEAPARGNCAGRCGSFGRLPRRVLLIACMNFANLMFARAERRRSEFIIRPPSAVAPSRLARQIAIECLILTFGAGAGALLIASWTLSIAMPVAATILSIETGFELSARVLAFAAACAALAACAGFVPRRDPSAGQRLRPSGMRPAHSAPAPGRARFAWSLSRSLPCARCCWSVRASAAHRDQPAHTGSGIRRNVCWCQCRPRQRALRGRLAESCARSNGSWRASAG